MIRLYLRPYVDLPLALDRSTSMEEVVGLLDGSPGYVIHEAGGFGRLVERAERVPAPSLNLRDAMEEHIRYVARQVDTRVEAARILGVNYSTLYRILGSGKPNGQMRYDPTRGISRPPGQPRAQSHEPPPSTEEPCAESLLLSQD